VELQQRDNGSEPTIRAGNLRGDAGTRLRINVGKLPNENVEQMVYLRPCCGDWPISA
jgi:hypothetical protein